MICNRSLHAKTLSTIVCVCASMAHAPAPAGAADLRMSISHVAADATGGSFEIDLGNQGSSQTYGVAGFSVELIASDASGIAFTGATTTTISPYIFDGSGTASVDPAFTFASATSTPTDLLVADIEWTSADVPIAPGATVGLAFISYTISPGAPGGLDSLTFGPGTSLTDANAASIDFDTPATSAGSVPEPSGILMLALAISAVCLVARRPAGVKWALEAGRQGCGRRTAI